MRRVKSKPWIAPSRACRSNADVAKPEPMTTNGMGRRRCSQPSMLPTTKCSICDNSSTHKHDRVQRWVERHPRFHLHFTPTSSSWLNMVERFFRDLTQNRLRRGVFRDVEELITAIGDYIDHHNQSPKPFIWTARAADILEKVKRARHTLHKRQSE